MRRWIERVFRFIRWSDWGPGKIPVLCTVLFYVGLSRHQVSAAFVLDCALFVIFAILHSALGYVANDWGDRELDALHGKPNAFAGLTSAQGRAAFAGLLILAVLSGLSFVGRSPVLLLWALWGFFALAYSLKPLRLKERGAWGLGFSFLAQWSLPVFLVFAALKRFGGWDMIVFATAITISGATLEIAHQRWDRTRDMTTETHTLGSRLSASRLDRLYTVAILLDRTALGAILIAMALKLAPVPVRSWSLSPALPLLGVYVMLFAAALYEMILAARNGMLLDPYYSSQRTAAKLLHETMPNLVMPAYLMLVATCYQPINALPLLAFLAWRLVLGQADWRWPLRAARSWLGR
jgi:4-hydroxybenzoate polyprenyltransferase